jgi:hypothetical protein
MVILSTRLFLGLPSGLFPSGIPLLPHSCYMEPYITSCKITEPFNFKKGHVQLITHKLIFGPTISTALEIVCALTAYWTDI